METLGKIILGRNGFCAVFVTSIVVLLADNAMAAKLFSARRLHAARWISAFPGNIRRWSVT